MKLFSNQLLKLFQPTFYEASVFTVDYEELHRRGRLNLLFDLDNTLVARDEKQVSTELAELFARLKADGFKLAVISNNWGRRVRDFAAAAQVPVIGRALKPLPRAFKRGLAVLGASPETTAVIGDQMFTDILGAKRLGLAAILVEPVSQVDLAHTKLLRHWEKFILRKLAAADLLPERRSARSAAAAGKTGKERP